MTVDSSLSSLGTAQFFISIVVAILLFGIMPSGWMFGERRGSQTFMANYPILHFQARKGSIFLGLLVFGRKLTESYFFLILAFRGFYLCTLSSFGSRWLCCGTRLIRSSEYNDSRKMLVIYGAVNGPRVMHD